MSEQKIEMTRAEFAALKKELDQKEGERPRIIDAIATARAHGDLSENAEYHAAREEQGQNEARIKQIRAQLENAQIIEVLDDGVCAPGKVVTIQEPGADPETYLLGQRSMKGGDYDVLTPESPMGSALLGKAVGEKTVARLPSGAEIEIEIVEVRAL